MNRAWTEWAGIAATVAAALASAGDLLLLGVAASVTPALAADGRFTEPALVVGYYLGVLAIPLYPLGYWYVSRVLPRPYAKMVVVLGACGAVIGAIIHGATGVALHARVLGGVGSDRIGGDPLLTLAPFNAYLAPLWVIVAAALLAGSILFAIPVVRGASTYPRWMAAANPAVLIIVIALCAGVSAWSRTLIVPASPNLAHVVFFALASTQARSEKRR